MMTPSPYEGRAIPRRAIGLLLLAAAALLALAIAPQAAPAKSKKVKVMTRNLYLGADLAPAILAPNVPALEAAAGKVYEDMLANDFQARAKLIAREIKKRKPHLIGLQELTKWLRGPKDDPSAAEVVVVDFLKILRKQLKKRGLTYTTAVKLKNTDIEVPTDKGLDARLIDFDAILALKKSVKVQKTGKDNFDARLTLPLAGGALGTIDVLRGYVEANVKVGGKKIHFVNTHLEAFLAATRNAQAVELTKSVGPLQSKRRVILVGDLNSDPAGASPEAFDTIVADGFKDRGVSTNTCCYDPDLLGGTLTSRVDHVLVDRGKGLGAKVSGNSARTPGGLYASDHLGVYSKLKIK